MNKKISKIVLIFVCIICWFSVWFFKEKSDSSLYVYFLNVGQGDAELIRMPDGSSILIDGGPDDRVLVELGKILPPWVRTIDLLIMTHPHADHLVGLLDVLERYNVKTIIWNPVYYEVPEYETFIDLLIARKLQIRTIVVIDNLNYDFGEVGLTIYGTFSGKSGVGENGRATLWCAQHGVSCTSPLSRNINNSSLVVHLSYGNFDVLFMGDAEKEVEQELLALHKLSSIKIEILKAGHHCSKTASSIEFLSVLRPMLAICSVGEDNKFGHPHQETLTNFHQQRIGFKRTDLDGTIGVKSDGVTWLLIK